MPKLTIVGAGSFVFARRLITDMLTFDSLKDSTITLMDINQEKLDMMTKLAKKMVEQEGTKTIIEATTNLEEACIDADYVATMIRVGDSRDNVAIPRKYGISYAIGDTSGISGAFYFLTNAGAILNVAKTMERVCPSGLLLNYTNPMTMLSKMVLDLTDTKYVGLCHSVQGTAQQLAEYLDLPFDEVAYKVAGINHMAWFLEFKYQGKDAYPLLWKALDDPEVYKRDVVRWEIMKYLGAFVTESSIHTSEYNAYFRRTPEMIDRYTNENMWGVMPKGWTVEERLKFYKKMRADQEEENLELANGDGKIPIERSHEYFSRILNAIETNEPYVFNGNVRNNGLISNLPAPSVVEVPIMTDANGLNPCFIGELPTALAAYDQNNLNVQELVVEGFKKKDRKYIYQAAMFDNLVSSQLTLDQIHDMVDELFEAHEEFVDF